MQTLLNDDKYLFEQVVKHVTHGRLPAIYENVIYQLNWGGAIRPRKAAETLLEMIRYGIPAPINFCFAVDDLMRRVERLAEADVIGLEAVEECRADLSRYGDDAWTTSRNHLTKLDLWNWRIGFAMDVMQSVERKVRMLHEGSYREIGFSQASVERLEAEARALDDA